MGELLDEYPVADAFRQDELQAGEAGTKTSKFVMCCGPGGPGNEITPHASSFGSTQSYDPFLPLPSSGGCAACRRRISLF